MQRRLLIAVGLLAVATTALLIVPAWLDAAETTEETPSDAAVPSRGYLGVGLRGLTPELQTHFGAPEGSGVLVASVEDDSAAAGAGIRVGDVITAVDGLAVDSPRDLSREIRHRPGETVTIELYRGAQPLEIVATLGERQAHAWHHGGHTPEEWAELTEHWEKWGEELGEKWGRWGEEFGQRWGEEHGEHWRRWADEMAEHGEHWEEMGEEIGRSVEKALSEVDWDEIGRAVEESMKSLENIDWEGMSDRITRQMEELEQRLEQHRQPPTGSD